MRLLCLAAGLLLLAPTAGAYLLVDVTSSPTAPVAPGATDDFAVRITADCRSLVERGSLAQGVEVVLATNASPDVEVDLPSPAVFPSGTCAGAGYATQEPATLDVLGTLRVQPHARGLVGVQVDIVASFADGPTATVGTTDDTPGATSFVMLTGARVDFAAQVLNDTLCACPEALFQLRLANHGNVPTVIVLELVDVQAGVTVSPPERIVLADSGPLADRTITIPATLEDRKEGAFTLRLLPSYQFDPLITGAPASVSMLVKQDPAESKDAPPVAAPLLVAALLATAVLTRRRA